MRLTPQEIKKIIDILTSYMNKIHSELRLYGSRTDDSARGGDIDLLILLEKEIDQASLFAKKLDILVDLKTALGDQKIDLMVVNRKEILSDPFVENAYENSQLLKKFL